MHDGLQIQIARMIDSPDRDWSHFSTDAISRFSGTDHTWNMSGRAAAGVRLDGGGG